jgi:hypothetical protein
VRRLLAFSVLLAPLAARAGETNCWFDAGVLVVPAEVAGVAGDFVLDTGAPQTLMETDYALTAGLEQAQFTGTVRLAGMAARPVAVAAAKLGARTWWLPTPVAGVIGADVLKDYVLDVRFDPCRVGLWRKGEAPPFRPKTHLPLSWIGGRPTVPAIASDGVRTRAGGFVPATGSDTAVRLRDDLADAPVAAKREGLYPYGALRPKLRALSFAGELFENAPSGLLARDQAPAEGEIGAPALARFRLRFDFPAGRLLLAKEKGPPDRSGGP